MKKTFLAFLVLILSLSSFNLYTQNDKSQKTQAVENKSLLPMPKPLMREYEFLKQRAYPFETIPDNARINAIRQAEQMIQHKSSKAYTLAQQPEWKPIGPYEIGGKIGRAHV